MALWSGLLTMAMLGAGGGADEAAPPGPPETLRAVCFLFAPGRIAGACGSGTLEDPFRLRLPLAHGLLACEFIGPVPAPPRPNGEGR